MNILEEIKECRKKIEDYRNSEFNNDEARIARILEITKNNDTIFIHGEIITESMARFTRLLLKLAEEQIELDKTIFSYLRPIFHGFTITISSTSSLEEDYEYYEEYMLKFNLLDEPDKPDFYTHIAYLLSGGFDDIETLCEEFINQTYEFNIDSFETDLSIIDSSVYFAASPFILKKYSHQTSIQLKTKSEDVIKLEKEINENNRDFKTLLDEFYDNTNNKFLYLDFVVKSLSVLNVGQGNLNILYNENEQDKIVFDIGFTFLEEHDNHFSDTIDYIQSLKSACYIISHYHIDHFLGVIYLNDNEFTKTWFFPFPLFPNEISYAAKCLLIYLISINKNSKKLFFLKDPNNTKNIHINITSEIIAALGTGKKYNSSGISLLVKKPKNILLTGDCPYIFLEENLIKYLNDNQIDCLVVPHHGSITDISTDSNNYGVKFSNESTAIIPVGYNNYGHPNEAHIKILEEKKKINIKQTNTYDKTSKTWTSCHLNRISFEIKKQ